jgi:hypothetical protein
LAYHWKVDSDLGAQVTDILGIAPDKAQQFVEIVGMRDRDLIVIVNAMVSEGGAISILIVVGCDRGAGCPGFSGNVERPTKDISPVFLRLHVQHLLDGAGNASNSLRVAPYFPVNRGGRR